MAEAPARPAPEVVAQEAVEKREPEPVAAAAAVAEEEPAVAAKLEEAARALEEELPIVASVSVTLGEEAMELHVREGQTAEDAVAIFCRVNMPEEIAQCMRQLLPVVIDRLSEHESQGGLRGSA